MLLDGLRPKPFRGDVVAAGVVVLVTLVGVVEVRFADAWGAGAHLAYALAAWVFVGAMAVLSPVEGSAPRAYQSVLYVALFPLALGGRLIHGPTLSGAVARRQRARSTTGR